MSANQRVRDYLMEHEDEGCYTQDIMAALGLTAPQVRSCLNHLMNRPNSNIYHTDKNLYVYSYASRETKRAAYVRILDWWQERQRVEVTPAEVAEALDMSLTLAANQMALLTELITACQHIRHGVYIWDEDKTYKFQTQLDVVVDYLIEHGGAASMQQMEQDLGIHMSALCRTVNSIKSQTKKVKLRKRTYVELIEDRRK